MIQVGVDGGQSGCRAALVVDGTTLAIGHGPGFRYPEHAPPETAAVEAIAVALDDLGPLPGTPDTVALGLTGPCGNGAGFEVLAAALRDRLGPVPRIRVSGDHVISFAGALGLQPGLVLAVGTGVIALAANRGGLVGRADGWGYLFGDDGGGFWIGREGIRAALRAVDGRGPATNLRQLLLDEIGDPGQVHRHFYGADTVAKVAGFSRRVATAADAGDAPAQRIWAAAADQLAGTCAALAEQTFADEAFELAVVGGVLEAGQTLEAHLGPALAAKVPTATRVEPVGSALDGAVALAAADHAGPLEELIVDDHHT